MPHQSATTCSWQRSSPLLRVQKKPAVFPRVCNSSSCQKLFVGFPGLNRSRSAHGSVVLIYVDVRVSFDAPIRISILVLARIRDDAKEFSVALVCRKAEHFAVPLLEDLVVGISVHVRFHRSIRVHICVRAQFAITNLRISADRWVVLVNRSAGVCSARAVDRRTRTIGARFGAAWLLDRALFPRTAFSLRRATYCRRTGIDIDVGGNACFIHANFLGSRLCHLLMLPEFRQGLAHERFQFSIVQVCLRFFEFLDVFLVMLQRHAHEFLVEFRASLLLQLAKVLLMLLVITVPGLIRSDALARSDLLQLLVGLRMIAHQSVGQCFHFRILCLGLTQFPHLHFHFTGSHCFLDKFLNLLVALALFTALTRALCAARFVNVDLRAGTWIFRLQSGASYECCCNYEAVFKNTPPQY